MHRSVEGVGFMRYFTSVLFLNASLVAAQVPEHDGERAQFVCVDVDDRALVTEPSAAVSSIRSLASMAGEREISHCWSWNDVCPPRRITDDEGLAAASQCDQAQRLEVRVAYPESRDGRAQYRVTTAPVGMWREIPHHLLPTITTDSPAFSIPRDTGAWRLQAKAGDHASVWQDVSASQSSVILDLLPANDFRFSVTAGGAL